MSADARVTRETVDPQTVRLSAGGCSFTYRRLKPGKLLLAISGDDKGQFGTAAIDEVNAEFDRFGKLTLFVDAYNASGPATSVMEAWTAYFAANRPKFNNIGILVAPQSKLLHLTVSIVQHLSGMGGQLRVFGSDQDFTKAIQAEVPDYGPGPSR